MDIRLFLVDDDAGFRETLRQLLTQRKEAIILGDAGDGEEALRLTTTFGRHWSGSSGGVSGSPCDGGPGCFTDCGIAR